MNLKDYLTERHPTVNALTSKEAKVIGIDYPLQGGWVAKYGELELPGEVVEKLRAARKATYESASYIKTKKKSAKRHKAQNAKPASKPIAKEKKAKPFKKDKDSRKSMENLMSIIAESVKHFKSI